MEEFYDQYCNSGSYKTQEVDCYLYDCPVPSTDVTCSGQDVQRISVISNLPDLIKNNNDECMRRVVPKVREVLHVAQTEMQLAATSAFLQILQQQIVPIQNYSQTFLQTILNSVDSKDPDCANAWLETLLDVIDLLPKDVIKKEILGIAVAKGQLSQSVQARLSCCRILGKISTKFEPFVIKKEILPVVQSLCQDVDYEVRGCMCQQLDPVARGVGLEATKSAILPELVELTNDEESYVRIIGLETVVNILSLLDAETCTYTIIPLVCKFCQQAKNTEDSTLPVIAKQLGKLCHGMWDKFTEEQKHWFLEYYRNICRMGLEKSRSDKDSPSKVDVHVTDIFEEEDKKVVCRRNCAFNFPSIALLAGQKRFKQELYSTFVAFCKDPHFQVRKTIAACFHEIVKLVGPGATLLLTELHCLLKDESNEVLRGIVNNLPETLDVLSKGDSKTVTEARMNVLSEIIPSILSAEIVIFSCNDWRLQESLMSSLACLPKCCNSDDIYHKVIPVLFQKLKSSRALPVRHAAARSTLVLIRYLRKLEQREQLIHRLISDFCHGRSYHQRNLFIDMCNFFIELFSKSFFKQHLFDYVLELTSDPVANIRLRMCHMLPNLKRQVKLPYDRNHLQQLEAAVRKILINEKDRDVITTIKHIVEELDNIQVQVESLMSRRKNFDEDTEDQIKEEEEKKLIVVEEQERKEEESKAKLEKKAAGNSKIPAPKKSANKTGVAGVKTDIKKASSLPTTALSTSPSAKDISGISVARNLPPSHSHHSQPDIVTHSLVEQDVTSKLHPQRTIRGSKKYLMRSKSTTCIPSLSPIPKKETASRIPLKPQNGQNLSRRSLIIIDAASGGKVKSNLKTSSSGPSGSLIRKGSGSGSSSSTSSSSSIGSSIRRGSLTGITDTKSKSRVGANGLNTGPKTRKISK